MKDRRRDSEAEYKLCQAKGAAALLQGKAQTNKMRRDKEREKVERRSQAPAQIVHCYSQLHPACFVQCLANLKIVADMLI